jgi:hypothetical protein
MGDGLGGGGRAGAGASFFPRPSGAVMPQATGGSASEAGAGTSGAGGAGGGGNAGGMVHPPSLLPPPPPKAALLIDADGGKGTAGPGKTSTPDKRRAGELLSGAVHNSSME